MKNFNGKTAVITGAASGIGLALAKRAAAEGMNLVLADIDEAQLKTAADTLGLAPERLLLQRVDVRHEAEIKALADAAYARFGAVQLLFNNAGVGLARVAWETTTKDWEWVLGVNVWSVIFGVNEFLPRMKAANEPACIINTASCAGLLSPPAGVAYNVSKHAVVTLSETLYRELRMIQSPVDVALLCPAFVPTGIGNSERNRPADAGTAMAPGAFSQEAEKTVAKAISSGRLTAADMADATFEALKESRFYIIPHRRINAAIEQRMNEILNLQNPSLT